MADIVIWFACVWGCAILFIGIGCFAEQRKKPMWFWTGDMDKEIQVTDVKAHNKAHGTMWKKYSIWFWLAGITYVFSVKIALAILILSCTVGLFQLYRTYKKIEKKYIVG